MKLYINSLYGILMVGQSNNQ